MDTTAKSILKLVSLRVMYFKNSEDVALKIRQILRSFVWWSAKIAVAIQTSVKF